MEEATWEIEHDMCAQYPYLFDLSGISLSFTLADESPFCSECCNDLYGHFPVLSYNLVLSKIYRGLFNLIWHLIEI